MDLLKKLEILADAAKYDASCASSGTVKRASLGQSDGVGSTEGIGICHAYSPDGRCISLLKILLTNFCIFECAYCINRRSSNVRRARFTVDEVVALTMGFYRRNCIEGLFLSSGIIRNPTYTMEQVVLVARTLREDHGFRGYIHLKTIPDADPGLLAEAGQYADRLSINIELPSEHGLAALAPEKSYAGIRRSMAGMRQRIDIAHAERRTGSFAPAGQSTQMIVGAEDSSDRTIMRTSSTLYSSYRLRRIYYSAFSPIPDASPALPPRAAPLLREHRLYQADWLLRFYGFDVDELALDPAGNMELTIDPKLAWALRHRAQFPVDVNSGSREMLLRVPGLGVKSVAQLIRARRHRRLRIGDLMTLRVPLKKVRPFIVTADHHPGAELDGRRLAETLAPKAEQLALL